ncbi:uncharacterized protein MELLADRAFT_61357 [Melampsora larici-populina 98AG31]|uniref:Uncharacterized protein n=1 Tax=Melampsora larici-populina (strain 98AG31 / pathotype 3-4-7) TaxID=747676 RepID=F4REK4_MELLP|nr:uncharacterized protein MELLADRAFT_61357 [Melampsora larici-populina 98AG31]EGG09260.1 hypothetical protein MELLADRAFT_61357 [Melampsora larici-populina 98AG31]
MEIDEPFDTFKQRQRRRIIPMGLSYEEHHHESLNRQDTHEQISQSNTTSAKRPSQAPTRKASAKRMKSKSFDSERLTSKPLKRRLLRFSSLGIRRPPAASVGAHHRPEPEVLNSSSQDQQPNDEQISQPILHQGLMRHTVPVTLVPHKELIPISKLSLSSKDYTYLQTLAPLAFYREESHKSISNKSAPRGRFNALTRLKKNPVILPKCKNVRPRRGGSVLMRCPKPLRFIGDSNVKKSQLESADSLNKRQLKVTSSLTRPSTIRDDQILATSTASPVQITSPVSLANISTEMEQQVAKNIKLPDECNNVNGCSVSIPSSDDIPLARHVDFQVERSLQPTPRHLSEISTHKNPAQSSTLAVPLSLSNVTSNHSQVSQSEPKPSKLNHTQSYFGQLLHHLSDISSVQQFFSNHRTFTSNKATSLTVPPEKKWTIIKSEIKARIDTEECQKNFVSEPTKSFTREISPFLENYRPNDTVDQVSGIPDALHIAEQNEIRDISIFSDSEVSEDKVDGATTYITPDARVHKDDKDTERVAETQSSDSSLLPNRLPILESSTLDSSLAQRPKAHEVHEENLIQSYTSVSSSNGEESKTSPSSILAPETPPITPRYDPSTHLMTNPPNSNDSIWSSLGINSISSPSKNKKLTRLSSDQSLIDFKNSISSKSMSTISKQSIKPHPFLGKRLFY